MRACVYLLVAAAVALSVAGCPKKASTPRTPTGRSGNDPAPDCGQFAVDHGFPAGKKGSKGVGLAIGGRMENARNWPLQGVGGVHELWIADVPDSSCSGLVTIGQRDGAPWVHRPLVWTGPILYLGAVDLAGCEQVLPLEQRPLSDVDLRRLRSFAAPALVLQVEGDPHIVALSDGKPRLVSSHPRSWPGNTGSYERIGGVRLVPRDGEMVAEWSDIFHPDEYDGPPTSPVQTPQERVIYSGAMRSAVPADGVTSALAGALDTEPTAIAEAKRFADSRFRGGGVEYAGWYLVTARAADGVASSVMRYTEDTCGGIAVHDVVDLGAHELRWLIPLDLERAALAYDIVALETAWNGESFAEERLPAVSGRAGQPGEDSRYEPSALVSFGSEPGAGLAIVSAGQVLWQEAPAPKRIELVRGVSESPYLVADGILYRRGDSGYVRY